MQLEAALDPPPPPAPNKKRGPASFCVPRAAINALLDQKATAYDIASYLVLARGTDDQGVHTTWSISAINRKTGANKVKGGPVDRALKRLAAMRATPLHNMTGPNRKQSVPTAPILIDRSAWIDSGRGPLPDGPTARSRITFVLPDLGEDRADRVWFDSRLVDGHGQFGQPLKALKNAGDAAARLLLALYAANDMENWGGVRPVGDSFTTSWIYASVVNDVLIRGGARLLRAKRDREVASTSLMRAVARTDDEFWQALYALEAMGLIYEVVMVLNRDPVEAKLASGRKYHRIADEAEPLYELDSCTRHGHKPSGEEGLAGATARTAGELGHSVATSGGEFNGTYAAIVPQHHPAMIAGIYRLRFRVANPRNSGVSDAWGRIRQNQREAHSLIQRVRRANGLPPLPSPDLEAEAVQ